MKTTVKFKENRSFRLRVIYCYSMKIRTFSVNVIALVGLVKGMSDHN